MRGVLLAQGLFGLVHRGRQPAPLATLSRVDLRLAEIMASGATGPPGEGISVSPRQGKPHTTIYNVVAASTPSNISPGAFGGFNHGVAR